MVALTLLEVGLLVHEGGENLWSRVPLWSAFATLAGVVGLAVLAGRSPGPAGTAWPAAGSAAAGGAERTGERWG